jgi:hypothetical protein
VIFPPKQDLLPEHAELWAAAEKEKLKHINKKQKKYKENANTTNPDKRDDLDCPKGMR